MPAVERTPFASFTLYAKASNDRPPSEALGMFNSIGDGADFFSRIEPGWREKCDRHLECGDHSTAPARPAGTGGASKRVLVRVGLCE